VVVLTGAGISAESGVPTFRGAGGLWREHRALDLATPEAFARDPDLVWNFYAWRRELIAGCTPNAAHLSLADLATRSNLTLITQNVDGLHQAAGSTNVLELHGSLWRLRCTACRQTWADRNVPLLLPPTCPDCGSLARPDVVWFGEQLPRATLNAAKESARAAAVFACIGTSGLVEPAAGLARIAHEFGAQVVEINVERTPLSAFADRVYEGPATAMVSRWISEVVAGNLDLLDPE